MEAQKICPARWISHQGQVKVLILSACNDVYADHHATTPRKLVDEGRLFVTDGIANHVHMYDLVQKQWTDVGLLPSSTIPYATADGRFVVVSSRNSNAISFMKSGLNVVSDIHGDIVLRGSPRLSNVDFSQTAPGHVSTVGGRMVVFFDGTLRGFEPGSPGYRNATGFVFDEQDLAINDENMQVRILFNELAHHGNAWPAPGCNWVHSIHHPGDLLPHSFVVVNEDMELTQSFENVCARYHGFAMTSQMVGVAGCGTTEEGAGHFMVMMYNSSSEQFAVKQMKYPDASNARSSTVWSYGDMTYAIANYRAGRGYNAVVRVDPSKDSLTASDVLNFPPTSWPAALVNNASLSYAACSMGVMKGAPYHIVAMLPDGMLPARMMTTMMTLLLFLQ
eukprot:TRINITY_DN3050_c0_g1_i1.p1 TRINITY_DN3050_c0_g1~~TRINITY_DN3050_c0_g1_i1.p1  ORF type:complete len:392 (+),score=120.43 TRINITY_DN3050_c0_g1_i1:96-1271(+)